MTLRDKEHRSEIREARNVMPLFRIERSQLCQFGHVYPQRPRKNSEISPLDYSLHPRESGPGGVTISPTLLGSILVWKQHNYLKLHAVDREVFRVLLGLLPRDSAQRKSGHKNE